MALIRRVLRELEAVLIMPNPTNLDIWIICSCTNLPLDAAQTPLAIAHIGLDLTHENMCLALSARGQNYLQQIKKEAMRIAERDRIYLSQIHYACHYHALHNLPLPFATPVAED